ncbi:putative mitochondrial protein [Andalucia godoyi]|uniref:Putative mitochondrial protein n=1 Tax=Andalucia godoyi TaxID=505711 RepID=A0A8K0F2L3_ANDGO|nr:putative mitochondrial protein [Andalucia godoyi]|eukprot:ANDGO_02921.mRNA.1 putative mitochondrial protein
MKAASRSGSTKIADASTKIPGPIVRRRSSTVARNIQEPVPVPVALPVKTATKHPLMQSPNDLENDDFRSEWEITPRNSKKTKIEGPFPFPSVLFRQPVCQFSDMRGAERSRKCEHLLKSALQNPFWGRRVSEMFQKRLFLHAVHFSKNTATYGIDDPAQRNAAWRLFCEPLIQMGSYFTISSCPATQPGEGMTAEEGGVVGRRVVLTLNLAGNPTAWFQLVDMALWYSKLHPLLRTGMETSITVERRTVMPALLEASEMWSALAAFHTASMEDEARSMGGFLVSSLLANMHSRLVLDIFDEDQPYSVVEQWIGFLSTHFGWSVGIAAANGPMEDEVFILSTSGSVLESWMRLPASPFVRELSHGPCSHDDAYALLLDDIAATFQRQRRWFCIPITNKSQEVSLLISSLIRKIAGNSECWTRKGSQVIEWSFLRQVDVHHSVRDPCDTAFANVRSKAAGVPG